jgi:hypothetical protein
MFHAEIREGTHVVREFNLDERALWVRYLAPLMGDGNFVREGHEWIPRKTRIKILEGPELRPDQISMGRGWPNAQRGGTDVTQPVMTRARELQNASTSSIQAASHPGPSGPPTTAAGVLHATGGPSEGPVPGARILQERLIGRLGAGPVTASQIEALARSAMPDADPLVRRAACERAVWELLATGEAQLAESDR